MSLRIRACALYALDVPPDFNLKIVSNSLTRLHKEEVEKDGDSKIDGQVHLSDSGPISLTQH